MTLNKYESIVELCAKEIDMYCEEFSYNDKMSMFISSLCVNTPPVVFNSLIDELEDM